jgi:hypothetical protein
MPLDKLQTILAFSCAIPAVMGMVWYNHIEKKIYPFVWAMWLSLFTESVHTILRVCFDYNNIKGLYWIVANNYVFFNIIFYLLFFMRQKVIDTSMFKLLLILCTLCFIANCFIYLPTKKMFQESNLVNNLIIFFLAAKLLNSQIFSFKGLILKNPLFIIGVGTSLFCSIVIFIKVFYLFQPKTGFNIFLHDIKRYGNAATYLLFAWAFICMPKRGSINLEKLQKHPFNA